MIGFVRICIVWVVYMNLMSFIGDAESRQKGLDRNVLYSSMKSISGFSDAVADFGVAGRREATADGTGGTKTRRESRLMDSPPFPKITGFFIPSF